MRHLLSYLLGGGDGGGGGHVPRERRYFRRGIVVRVCRFAGNVTCRRTSDNYNDDDTFAYRYNFHRVETRFRFLLWRGEERRDDKLCCVFFLLLFPFLLEINYFHTLSSRLTYYFFNITY